MRKRILITLIIFLYAPLVFGLPGLKQWRAVWNENPEADLAGYFRYHKAPGGEFTDANRVDVGNNTECSLSDVPTGSIIAVTAYDTSGNEGGFSSEVPFDKDGIAPAAVGGLQIVEE